MKLLKIVRPRLSERGYINHFDYNTNSAAYLEYSVSDEEYFSDYDGYSRENLNGRESVICDILSMGKY